MKKIYATITLPFFLVLFSFTRIIGSPISEEVAGNISLNLFIERSNFHIDEIESTEIIPLIEKGDVVIFVMRMLPNGFVIISADDKAPPILGYSFEGTYEPLNLPVQYQAMESNYRREIYQSIQDDVTPTEEIRLLWEKYSADNFQPTRDSRNVPILISARFNQPTPWNVLCPEDPQGPGGHALVGCVAVSMAQVMHYWSYPAIGAGSHGYTHSDYGYLYADFENTFYDFENMPSSPATPASQLLLYHCGVAIDMGYGADGSGAWVGWGYPCAMTALEEHFLYQSSIHFEEKDSYSDSQWDTMMRTELDNGRPLVYRGYDNSGGHAWNIDGYQGDYYHCNWGWGGSADGYFLLSNLNAGGYNFSSGQAAIMGIEPEDLNVPNLILENTQSVEISGDGDNVINPGETANIVVSIRNRIPWPAASDVQLTLNSTNEYVSIINNYAEISSIDTDESATNMENPFVVFFSQEAPLGDYTFNLSLTASTNAGLPYERDYTFSIELSLNQLNFPIDFGQQVVSTPIVVDIDNDGDKEIISADYQGNVHLLNSSGEEFSNWPVNLGDQIWGSPSVGDIDNDGNMEIVVTSKTGYLSILDAFGNIELDFYAGQYLMGSPALGNLDDDEELEIVFCGYTPFGKIFALNHDGTNVPGFPLEINERMLRGVALADIANNGFDDIICTTEGGDIILIDHNGVTIDGFPFHANDKFKTAPSVLQLPAPDEYGHTHIIFSGNRDNSLYAINDDGTLRFEIQTGGNINTSVGITSLYGGHYGVFFGSDDDYLYGVDENGNMLPGWPRNLGGNVLSSSVFSDLDGDGILEVISAAGSNIFAFHMDGTLVQSFPINVGVSITGSPCVAKLDEDDDIEIFIGTNSGLFAIDMKTPSLVDVQWSTYRGNIYRNGTYLTENNVTMIGVSVQQGWNLVGLPVTVADASCSEVFPSSSENTLYTFENDGYSQEESLVEGRGYWLRFPDQGWENISGGIIESVTLNLSEGWNLICGISETLYIDEIVDTENIIVPNTLFYYDNGFVNSNELIPGNAYWVRSNGEGSITLINQ